MLPEHIHEAEKVWKETKQLIEEGRIVKEIKIQKNGKKRNHINARRMGSSF